MPNTASTATTWSSSKCHHFFQHQVRIRRRFVNQLLPMNPAMHQLAFWWLSAVWSQCFCCQHSWCCSYCPQCTFSSLSHDSQTGRLQHFCLQHGLLVGGEVSRHLPSHSFTYLVFYTYMLSVHISSVAQSYLTLCDPVDCSTPGLPVNHQVQEFTQTHVHWVSDAIQPSHPLSSPSLPTFNLSQHQGLFQWVSSSYQVAKSIRVSASSSVLPMNTQDWSPLGWTGWISLQSKRLSRVFSNINDSNSRRRVLWVPMGFRTYYTKIWPFSILNILNWRNLRKGMYRKGFLPFPRSRSLNPHVRGDFLYSEEGTQRGMWMNKPWQFPPVYHT